VPVSDHVSILTVERIGIVALVLILFDGGMEIRWSRFRAAAGPITALGIAGTFATAAAMAALAHALFGLAWMEAWLLGAALAPTDPALVFSVLGGREVEGRSGTILKGEAGANDPAGIALMMGLIALDTRSGGSAWTVVAEFARQMGIGLVVGLAGGVVLAAAVRRAGARRALPLLTLAGAGALYEAADLAHGSGFLAVFVAGMMAGDVQRSAHVERVHGLLAGLGEVAVFAALGVTVSRADLGADVWRQALVLAALLALVVRPLAAAPLLALARLGWTERLFVMWGGLKGAVPILLAAFALEAGATGASEVYGTVFVAVAVSVVVQGGTVPAVARRLGIPMRLRDGDLPGGRPPPAGGAYFRP